MRQTIEIIKAQTNQLMAKVVLLWNEHSNENLAGYHARRCATLLKEMGHEVVVEKVPYKETIQAKLLAGTPKEAAKAILDYEKNQDASPLIQRYEKKHNAPVFSFHTSHLQTMGKSEDLPPERFNTQITDADVLDCEIGFLPKGKSFYVEVPAVYHPISNDTKNKRKIQFERVWNEYVRLKKEHAFNLHEDYHLKITKLGKDDQQKYLNPIITNKIACAIHEIIENKKTGKPKSTMLAKLLEKISKAAH